MFKNKTTQSRAKGEDAHWDKRAVKVVCITRAWA